MNELPPELPAEIRDHIRNQNLRALNFKFIVAAYVVAMGLLTIVLHSGFNPMLRPSIMLLSIVGGVGLFLRYQTSTSRSRPSNLSDPNAAAPPQGARKGYDLKDLPPELVANHDVQKMFEWARAQDAWLKVTPHDQFTNPEDQNPETVKIGVSLGDFLAQAGEKVGTLVSPKPVSSRIVSVLSRIVTWASFILIFAALAAAAVAYLTLNGGPNPHWK